MRADSSGPMPAIGSSSSSMRGLRRQRHRDLELALLAVAHAGDHDVGALCRPTRSSAARAGSRSCASSRRALRQNRNEWPACACTASADIVERGEIGKQRGDLERAREPHIGCGDATGSAVMSSPVEADAAGIGRDLAGELADQRGLAGAVRADDGVQFAARDVERDLIGRDHAAEALGQVHDLQQGLSHGRPSRAGVASRAGHSRRARRRNSRADRRCLCGRTARPAAAADRG